MKLMFKLVCNDLIVSLDQICYIKRHDASYDEYTVEVGYSSGDVVVYGGRVAVELWDLFSSLVRGKTGQNAE